MKKSVHSVLLAGLLAMVVPLSASAAMQTLSNLYVFGDSLSDGGNYNGPGGPGAFPPPPYAGARYSNGPTAVEYLWQAYNPGNTSFKPSNFGGTNYALGGATTGSFGFNSINPGVPAALQPWFASQGGVANQVTQFSGGCTGCFIPASSLFVVWAFPNDIFANALFNQAPQDLIGAGIANIVAAIQTLALEGAQHFLIPNMPDLGVTPDFRGGPQAPGLTFLTQAFNTALGAALTQLDQAMDAEIVQFDTYSAVADARQNPSKYGLTNVNDNCTANLANQVCDPNTWLYWDGVHPTAAAHRILGAQLAAAIPEPGSLTLVVPALMLLALRGRSRSRMARRLR